MILHEYSLDAERARAVDQSFNHPTTMILNQHIALPADRSPAKISQKHAASGGMPCLSLSLCLSLCRVYLYKREKDIERERERHRERERESHTERDTETHREREKETETDRDTQRESE